ncbi:unnamed protein product [Colias eurytheme]|nr:unnamed protein product [Colias eurytheme]
MDPGLIHSYIKLRKNFGQQPMFCEVAPVLLDSINPDKQEQRNYCLRNPVDKEVQASASVSESYANTKITIRHDTGVNHYEGGWPKEISFTDEEATARYRRRFERDDTYVDAVLNLYPQFEHYINQNNGLNAYNIYFKEMKSQNPVEKPSIMINSVYKDPQKRPVSCIAWTYEDKPKLAISYCDRSFPEFEPVNKDFLCFIWDIENPSDPYTYLSPPTACWQLVCSPASPNIFVGGLEDGKVCIFDTRVQFDPILISPAYVAHRDPVNALLFIPSRLNIEFFSGSTDGKCMWWDMRNTSFPIDSLIMSVRIPPGEQISLANSEGVSCLQYDKAFPTKFLCGTDSGLVISVNRKGKTYQEVMSGVFYAHDGPVKAVQRSPCSSKFFITCGDWRVNVWSDDLLSSPIISGIRHRKQINDVVWSPHRFSGYMSVCDDGKFRFWDLLRRYREPIAIMPVSQEPLLKIKPNEDGRLIAIGDAKGVLHLLSLSETLVSSGEGDKQLMTQSFERETHRERILENRVKEITLKFKSIEDKTDEPEKEEIDEEELFKSVEDEYQRIVLEEMRHTEVNTGHSFNIDDTIRTR